MAVQDFHKERQYWIMGVFAFLGVMLVGRAAQLQLIDSTYRTRAEALTIEKDVMYPSRGVIYDRNMQLLVYNDPLYDLMVTYKKVSKTMDTARFCRLLGITDSMFKANLDKDWVHDKKFSKSIPYPFMQMVDPEIHARLQECLPDFPGFYIQTRNVRGFPQHNAAHVIGYISEVNDAQIKKYEGVYEPGDYIGTAGLEKFYEPILRGKKGFRYILRDNLGRLVGQYKNGQLDSAAVAGRDLLSSIDLKLQTLAEKCLEGKVGAIVAIEPSTGEILAMCSSPTYDPAKMAVNRNRSEFIKKILHDTLKPLYDRTAQAEYPPGSVYKPMLGVIALQMGVWDKNNGVGCARGYHYRNLTIKCHAHNSAGNIREAIAHSCNAYFCTLFRSMVDKYEFKNPRMGLDSLNAYIARFGLGKPLGIDYPGEQNGQVPDSKFYDKMITKKGRGPWYSTSIVSLGIGQGENLMTTMQIANLVAIIANRGYYHTPHLVKAFKDGDKIEKTTEKYLYRNETLVESRHFEEIINGMQMVIDEGTGSNARIDGITVCGKTGTSQNPHGEDNSVFMGFAPKNEPRIAVAVYIENGGSGNDFAAPITGLMIEQYLKGSLPKSREWLVEKMRNSRLVHSSGKGYYVLKAAR
ncbi:MAG: hypothetical protein RL757_857 [Bacteroidota bacterium]|jgi:penicillin-binding protein 2